MSIEDSYLIDCLKPSFTGVDVPVWISCENYVKPPQIKVKYNNLTFDVGINEQDLIADDPSKIYFIIPTCILIMLQMWIRINKQHLLDYWHQIIDTATFLCLMTPLRCHIDITIVNLQENIIFPAEKYKLQIRSTDSLLPHFHVISREEGYDIRLLASDGGLLYIDQYGSRSRNDTFADVESMASEWLNRTPAHPKSRTAFASNREYVLHSWNASHNRQKYSNLEVAHDTDKCIFK